MRTNMWTSWGLYPWYCVDALVLYTTVDVGAQVVRVFAHSEYTICPQVERYLYI